VLAAVALTLVVVAEWGVTSVLAPGLTVSFSIIVATLGTIPIAIGIAILRHRLFDLDLVIRRSIVFGGGRSSAFTAPSESSSTPDRSSGT
jgi:hypothetical protein